MISPSKFAGKVLAEVEKNYPELYAKHIGGRHIAFIRENKPPQSKFSGQFAGSVPPSLKMLWALGSFFSAKKMGPCRRAIGKICNIAFWEFLIERLHLKRDPKTQFWTIDANWSILVVARDAASGQVPDGDLFTGLLDLLEMQTVADKWIAGLVQTLDSQPPKEEHSTYY